MGEIKYDDYTEEEQALMKGAPYVMKPLQGQDDAAVTAACHGSVGVCCHHTRRLCLSQCRFALRSRLP